MNLKKVIREPEKTMIKVVVDKQIPVRRNMLIGIDIESRISNFLSGFHHPKNHSAPKDYTFICYFNERI
jgi:hypothetical protein